MAFLCLTRTYHVRLPCAQKLHRIKKLDKVPTHALNDDRLGSSACIEIFSPQVTATQLQELIQNWMLPAEWKVAESRQEQFETESVGSFDGFIWSRERGGKHDKKV
jgi:hypothetical protein